MAVPCRPSFRSISVVAILLAILLAGCTSSDSSSNAKQTGSTELPGDATPQVSAEKALAALLGAEQRGDYAASYALLSKQGRRASSTASQWERRRSQLAAVTGFDVEASPDGSAIATVRHDPALDAFRGLTPAEERQWWNGRKVRGGWLLDADPRVKFVLPSRDEAKTVARSWAQAVQRCDQPGARSLQAVDQLFGDAAAASGLCGSSGAIVGNAVGRLRAGPESADVVAQYSTDALTWARTVELTQPVTARVVLAPLGETWKVIGVFAPSL